jgi:hypothetical protein
LKCLFQLGGFLSGGGIIHSDCPKQPLETNIDGFTYIGGRKIGLLTSRKTACEKSGLGLLMEATIERAVCV